MSYRSLTPLNHRTQYFLITPKLLPKLAYDPNMRVLCVFNGEHMLPHTEWNVQSFLEKRRALNVGA